jgi:hypothetical protein
MAIVWPVMVSVRHIVDHHVAGAVILAGGLFRERRSRGVIDLLTALASG